MNEKTLGDVTNSFQRLLLSCRGQYLNVTGRLGAVHVDYRFSWVHNLGLDPKHTCGKPTKKRPEDSQTES